MWDLTMADSENNITLDDWNSTLAENNTLNEGEEGFEIDVLYYIICVPPLLLLCFVSVIINIKVLVSVFWLRSPISPTLKISLSLAAADALASFLWGASFFINSLLAMIYKLPEYDCYRLTLEVFRVSATVCSIFHLLALTGNHYLGILKPLHYASIMTPRNITFLLILLWLTPNVFFIFYFYMCVPENEGFLSPHCKSDFILHLQFRLLYSITLIIPFLIMVVIYTHIFVIVQRHQAERAHYLKSGHLAPREAETNSSQLETCLIRTATTKSTSSRNTLQSSMDSSATSSGNNGCKASIRRGPDTLLTVTDPSSRSNSSRCRRETERRSFNRNVKAIHTTIYIVGSFFIGLMPLTTAYTLICNDCAVTRVGVNPYVLFLIFTPLNLLYVLKTLVNPMIYAARMQDIKNASIRMNESCYTWFCSRFINVEERSRQFQLQHQYRIQSTNGNNRHRCPGEFINNTSSTRRTRSFTNMKCQCKSSSLRRTLSTVTCHHKDHICGHHFHCCHHRKEEEFPGTENQLNSML